MTDLTALKGIGEKSAPLYSKLGIFSVEDALFYFPRDYITYEPVTDRLSCDVMIAFEAVVLARPLMRRVRRLSIVTAKLNAGSELVTATWFNMPFLAKSLKPGSSYIFRGKLTVQGDHYHIEQPQIFTQKSYDDLLGRINPIYHLTKGLSNNAITNTVRKSFDLVGENYKHEIYDMHFPKDEKTLISARNTLVYDEFLQFIIKLRMLRDESDYASNDFHIMEVAECERIIEKLPYRLTGAQLRVWGEIKIDLCEKRSMRRLVQGDVGSGKTILATLACVMVAVNGYQSAIMAPTEILAQQHYESISNLLKESSLDIKVVLLTGSMSESAKKNVRRMIEEKEADIIIGTHALFYEKVVYKNLALVVTDEQHRFGVNQRTLLSSKNSDSAAHVLVMSATPIPRTLAIILYGDLSISLVDELPAHKKPIKNAVVGESYRKAAYNHMEKEIKAGHQVYVICPLIEESEGMDARNVVDTASEMSSYFDDDIKIGILHGRMKASEKQKVMNDFAAGYIDILVSTTVVEVGVNVPNATFMMIENSERFGLAALHQLRGRIGRGSDQSYCVFMTSSSNPDTIKRLEILKSSNDGFKIAEEDLKMRGPGDMFGMRQSGDLNFMLGDIYSDAQILKRASDDADAILKDDPKLMKPEHLTLKNAIERSGDIGFVGASL